MTATSHKPTYADCVDQAGTGQELPFANHSATGSFMRIADQRTAGFSACAQRGTNMQESTR